MNFDLPTTTSAHADRARLCARDLVAPAATEIDRTGRIPHEVRAAAQALMSADDRQDDATFCVVIEELAVASAATALTVAGGVLGAGSAPDVATQWPGLRGADIDGLRARFGGDAHWDLAVTAALVGLARAAVAHATTALRAARAAGTPNESADAPLADAATVADAARLLLWDAAREGRTGAAEMAAARGMARLQALDAVALALGAAERAGDLEASRPGAVLERISRDAATAGRVLGDEAAARAAVAGAVLPA